MDIYGIKMTSSIAKDSKIEKQSKETVKDSFMTCLTKAVNKRDEVKYNAFPMVQNVQKRIYTIYMKTDDMLYSGGNGTGLSFYLKYAENSTKEEPIIKAKGVDENGKEFEQEIYINKINPRYATIVEMRALEAYLGVEKQAGFSSLPYSDSDIGLGLQERRDFIDMFKKTIYDMKLLGQKKSVAYYQYAMQQYLNFIFE